LRLEGREIVCVGFADWDTPLPTNQHHLMGRLAERNKVLFVESLGLRQPRLARADLRRIVRRLRLGFGPPRSRDGVWVLSPLVLPFHRLALVRRLNGWLLPRLVRRAARRLGLRRPILWGYVPQAELLLDALEPERVIYHCVDDIAVQEGIDADSFHAAERRFAARADLVIASAPNLIERMRALSGHVLEAPNVADTALFASALEPGPADGALEPLPRPRVVFHGAITAAKLDLGLLAELARLRPAWSVVLVGPLGMGTPETDLSALTREPNVHLVGQRRHEELPSVLRGADAGLIPYAINPLTSSVFPMKVYEYLAAGLPVVSTPLPALVGVDGIDFADDAAATVAALERELAGDSPERRRRRSAAAAGNSWEARIEQIEAALPSL
jgi:glycosyltransferase involved in cell wall biosynthesis